MITEEGKRALLGYLTGRYSRWSGAIIIGTGDAETGAFDKDLQFPVETAPVDIVVPEQITQSIISRATFTPNTHSLVHEIGLINIDAGYDFQRIVKFDASSEFFTGGTPDTTYSRVGPAATRLEAPGEILYTAQNQDFAKYNEQATFSLAVHNVAGTAAEVQVRLGQDDSNYFRYNTSVPLDEGYKVMHWLKGDMQRIGDPVWTNVSYISVRLLETADVVFDGFIVRSARENPDVLFVSRDVLQVPVQKVLTQNMDIEYRVRVNFA